MGRTQIPQQQWHRIKIQALNKMKKQLQEQAMKQGMDFLKKGSGHHGGHGHGGGHHGGHGHGGGHHGGHGKQGNMDKRALKEAMKVAKTKDLKNIDPAVLDYAATRLQAGFRGYQVRKNMKT